MTVEREVLFTEDDVQEWCRRSGDMNELHLSKDVASDAVFGERVVPGMMVLDKVSGLIEEYGSQENGHAILANIVACRFREPIPFDESVQISLEKSGEDNNFTYLDFEAKLWDELAVHGTVGILIE